MTREVEVERFLRQCAVGRPFQARQLADAVSDPAFEVADAECRLLRLLVQNRAYFRAGAWYPGASRARRGAEINGPEWAGSTATAGV